jgi:tetraacyldisaccharide 4'-kinase
MRVCLGEGSPAGPEWMGDEPYLLASRNPAHAFYVGSDRVAAARLAQLHDQPDLILLDDGYQHLRLARQLNVLLVDAERGLGNGHMLPLGVLREPVSALARADVILISKASLGDAEGLARRLKERHRVGVPVFRCDYRPTRLARLDGQAERPPDALAGSQVSLVCAIAQPGGFVRAVEELGARVDTLRALRDHDPFGPGEVRALERLTAEADPDRPQWLTTEKDAVKLKGRIANPERVWVLEMEVVPEPAAAAFFFDFLSGLQLE